MLEATAKYIKIKMKDWKESNPQLQKESIQLLKCMTEHCDRVPKRAVSVYAPYLCEKLGDVKLVAAVKEVYMILTDFVTAKFIANLVIKNGAAAKVPKMIENSCELVLTML